MTVPYPTTLAKALPESWSLAQILLSSSYGCWGTSSVSADAENIAKCVQYFRGIKNGKIVLMGHSTGCQDVMEYLVGPGFEERPPVDGGILQAPVSDREAMLISMPQDVYDNSVAAAYALVAEDKPEGLLPTSVTHGLFGAPVTARRWLSLTSPYKDGEEDYFSSDLSELELKRRFGALPARTPMCILESGADEHVPTYVDKAALVQKWIGLIKGNGGKVDELHSGVIEGASHNLSNNNPEVVEELVRRVVGFIGTLHMSASL
jgi:alpha-beta hydrolase superfamily lysophospholipase